MNQLPPIKKIKISDETIMETDTPALNEKALNLFSRQNAALGAETTAKLIKMKVLIYGMRGVGVETAKNLALQGAGAITIIDPNLTEVKDIGLNFFLHASDIGKPRALAIAPRLRELNPICNVSVEKALTEDVIRLHSALVITQLLPLPQLLSLNEFCRAHKISFFLSFVGGVSCDIFVDHGPSHIIFDANGDRPVQKLIVDVKVLSENECLIRYETPEGQQPVALLNGSFEVTEVQGINEINGKILSVTRDYNDPVKTVRVQFKPFENSSYTGGGIITEKKIPFKSPMEGLSYKLLNPGETLADPPTLVLTDLINFGSETQQHIAFYSLLEFYTSRGSLPIPNTKQDSEELLEIAKALLKSGKVAVGEDYELDEKLVLRYATYAGAELQPMAAFTGGVLAQEVVKCTGKFTPIPGFMHFSAPEALPNEDLTASETQPRGSRYEELASVYGWTFVEKLGSLKYFMVGCGALGCEFMKNFALNGICCGPNGKLVVTDADRIELSNLSRQFLFREHNVGQPKSRAAGQMATVMNSDFKVESMELFVGPKSEDVFNDDFWMALDGVCNALDNMEARLYVDKTCVKYEKSLLESGTMGTSGNVDTICPHKTRTYKDGGKAAEGGGVPMCTLRNFPHLTDHCIEWARDQFELLFTKLAKSLESYLSDPIAFEEKVRTNVRVESGSTFFEIRSLTSFAKLALSPSIGGCAQLAYDIFHFLFRDRILDLQQAFPPNYRIIDSETKQDKGPFWGEKKRYPTVVQFNSEDESHTSFILSATCLFAVMVGLIPPKREDDVNWLKEYRSHDWIVNITSSLQQPVYIRAPVNTSGLDNAPEVDKTELDSIVSNLLAELDSVARPIKSKANSLAFEIADFEKDDDLNFHIAFITSTANLRCDNYSIARTDFQSCKVIAGKIVAAIATTTAAVCGLVILELFKLVLEKDTEAYMNRAIGLAQYQFTSFTQEKPDAFKSTSTFIAPDPQTKLPESAYDDKGKIKQEYMTEIVTRAYPEGHTIWDKIVIPSSLTMKELSEWFEKEHKLKLISWDFIYGQKTVVDDEKKEKITQSVSTTIFPPKPVLDYSLLPSLELSLQQASMAIMKTAAAKPTQQYIALWKEFKALGSIPAEKTVIDPDVVTEATTLKQVLEKMSRLAAEAEAKKIIETRTIPSLAGRKFFVIPGGETPVCRDISTDQDIDHLCALKIIL